jgi:glucose/mannose-6-phosphate isomerase
MKDLIASLSNQIREAIKIGENTKFNPTDKDLTAILVCGLGGSGIGGKIVSLLLKKELKIPFHTVNDYEIPAWVDKNTLVIGSSYSGNTEETLAAIAEASGRGAEIAVITSGGDLLDMAKEKGWNNYVVPGGEQPRAMLAYSIVQQLFICYHYGLISDVEIQNLKETPAFIDESEGQLREEAMRIADGFINKRPIIYAGTDFEGVAVRWRQQINENAKELCWHHVLPEMTHNELVGWAGGTSTQAPLFLATDYDHPRTKHRWEITKGVISKYSRNIYETKAIGDSKLAQNFYLIHLGDWVSYFMSEIKKIDAVEVDVIIHLKTEMAKLS